MAQARYTSTYPELALLCHTPTENFEEGRTYMAQVCKVNAYGKPHMYDVYDDYGCPHVITVLQLKKGHPILERIKI